MASTNIARLTIAGPPSPHMGTIASAANQYFAKGTIVTRNASGAAVSPSTDDASGFPALGVSNASYDNRTGSEAGGLAGDLDVQVQFGVFGFDVDGTAPLPGEIVYVVDNHTMSTDSDSDARGFGGITIEVRDGQAYVLVGPHVSGLLASIAALIDAKIAAI